MALPYKDNVTVPACLAPHSADYKNKSWMDYTPEELSWFVRLLVKRALHRTSNEKATKDLYDAGNYLEMLKEHYPVKAAKTPHKYPGDRVLARNGDYTVVSLDKGTVSPSLNATNTAAPSPQTFTTTDAAHPQGIGEGPEVVIHQRECDDNRCGGYNSCICPPEDRK